MKKLILIFVLLSIQLPIWSQGFNGTIEFERKTFWMNIYTKFTFLTPEEVEREKIVWANYSKPSTEMYTLEVANNKTFYKPIPQTENYGYSSKVQETFYYRDLNTKTLTDLVGLGSKSFVITEEIPRTKWKIQNEIRDIQGYICMKASTTHPVYGTPVTAWYTDAIPVASGPEGFGGLPGMILLLDFNNEDLVVEAKKVTINHEVKEITLPKKIKGKATTQAQFNADKAAFVEKSFKMKRNPYYELRY